MSLRRNACPECVERRRTEARPIRLAAGGDIATPRVERQLTTTVTLNQRLHQPGAEAAAEIAPVQLIVLQLRFRCDE